MVHFQRPTRATQSAQAAAAGNETSGRDIPFRKRERSLINRIAFAERTEIEPGPGAKFSHETSLSIKTDDRTGYIAVSRLRRVGQVEWNLVVFRRHGRTTVERVERSAGQARGFGSEFKARECFLTDYSW